ncbi:hypothetical protein BC828DRAFT_348979 [Blastocladiella britannica]|nr:hypothetical protein BC828DRAFT_348979 [Blastocladiella britannica]
MYGDEAIKLVREAKRGLASNGPMPVYNETAVRAVLKEMRILGDEQDALVRELEDLHAATATHDDDNDEDEHEATLLRGISAAMVVHGAALERNRRCLLAYHAARVDKIKEAIWDLGGGGAGGSVVPPDMHGRLAPAEARFADRYSELLTAYAGAVPGIDLTAVPDPPKDLFVCVRVVADIGEIVTENGRPVVLRAGTQHFLRRADVERLITQGALVHVD